MPGSQVCALQYSPHCTAVLTCTHRTRDRLQAFCLAGITLQTLSDVRGAMQLLRTIRPWCPRWGFVLDPETHPQPGAAAVASNLHKLMHCHVIQVRQCACCSARAWTAAGNGNCYSNSNRNKQVSLQSLLLLLLQALTLQPLFFSAPCRITSDRTSIGLSRPCWQSA